MGWEILVYGNRQLHIQDSSLLEIQHFSQLELEATSSGDFGVNDETMAALKSYIDGWKWIGVGVVLGVDPEVYIQHSPARLNAFVKLLERTKIRIQGFGELVPEAYLNDCLGSWAIRYTRDMQTNYFTNVIDKVIDFLHVVEQDLGKARDSVS